MESFRKRLLPLNFAPFVLVNGMNLFPMFIFSQLFLAHEREVKYLMPLIFYYSFKTNILFLTRLKPMKMKRLLTLSISFGVLGCLAGTLISFNLLYGWLAGALLGACSGTLFPSYMTIQYHERDLNHFGTTVKEQFFSLGFALIFSLILFKLVTFSIGVTLFFLGLHLILLYFILSSYPAYHLEYDEKTTPHYSIIETFFLFFVGFFIIFILKIA